MTLSRIGAVVVGQMSAVALGRCVGHAREQFDIIELGRGILGSQVETNLNTTAAGEFYPISSRKEHNPQK
jgi:hypothetical protein